MVNDAAMMALELAALASQKITSKNKKPRGIGRANGAENKIRATLEGAA